MEKEVRNEMKEEQEVGIRKKREYRSARNRKGWLKRKKIAGERNKKKGKCRRMELGKKREEERWTDGGARR